LAVRVLSLVRRDPATSCDDNWLAVVAAAVVDAAAVDAAAVDAVLVAIEHYCCHYYCQSFLFSVLRLWNKKRVFLCEINFMIRQKASTCHT
jgi:hypothetical protein